MRILCYILLVASSIPLAWMIYYFAINLSAVR